MPDELSQPEGERAAGPRQRRTTVVTRLALAALLVSVGSIVASTLVAYSAGEGSGRRLAEGRLAATRSAKASEIERYFAGTRREVAAMGTSSMFVDGVERFASAFDELRSLSTETLATETVSVATFHADEITPGLERMRDEPVGLLQYAPTGDAAAIYLQYHYLAANPLPLDDKQLLTDAGDPSTWTDLHRDLHPTLRAIVDRFGFEDLFLVDAPTATVVYSTEKHIEFATSLETGPLSASPLAALVREVVEDPYPGRVFVADYRSYTPAFDAPVAFMATALRRGDTAVGVLVVGLPFEPFGEILTREWREGRLGETGEVYIVGPDRLMRSDSRALLTDRGAYVARLDEVGSVSEQQRRSITAQGTTVLLQPVDTDAVEAAFAVDDGVVSARNYLDRRVASAYAPLAIEGLDWVIVAEQERAEYEAPVNLYRQRSIVVAAVLVVGVSFLAVIWAQAFVAPIRAISEALSRVRSGDLDTTVPARGAREFRQLADGFNRMVDDLRARQRRVQAAIADKVELLHKILPHAAARSVDRGDRSVLETVPQATVAVLVVHGLDSLIRDRPVDENRDLLHLIVDQLDRLADVNGLGRVKVLGDSYFAVCGVDTPFLDHAPRALRLAFEARSAIAGLAERGGPRLALSAGLHSGPVTVGLTGTSRLIYDLWGDTVSTANRLARLARPGEVLVSDATRDRLPPDLATVAADRATAQMAAWVVSAEPIPNGAPR